MKGKESEIVYRIRPEYFGKYFNPSPKPDVFGRRPATPLEIEKAIRNTKARNKK